MTVISINVYMLNQIFSVFALQHLSLVSLSTFLLIPVKTDPHLLNILAPMLEHQSLVLYPNSPLEGWVVLSPVFSLHPAQPTNE